MRRLAITPERGISKKARHVGSVGKFVGPRVSGNALPTL